ncbi:hypothetical protein TCE0_043f15656 [Talaromyces pinophilus]|jgi:hypothetical protein|uniref:BZIP transcription factor n=1 Tax=Talaromyces pinophilus TaxID=128442 RepID=A0A0B8MYA6_TALPI|nr:hypothetical protein TCE0_043f15656 [Talaromyces pinophilus]
MSTARNTSLLSSSEKKRLRDRRAQQTLREKRQNRMMELEARVAFCEKNHGGESAQLEIKQLIQGRVGDEGQDMQKLLETVEKLRLENNRLRERQESLRRMVGSWESSDEQKDLDAEGRKERRDEKRGIRALCGRYGGRAVSEIDYRTSSSPAVDNQDQMASATSASPAAMPMSRTDSAPLFGVSAPTLSTSLYQFAGSVSSAQNLPPSPHPIIHLPSPPAVSSSVPAWCRVPRNTYETNNTRVFPLISSRWFSHPELITPCPLQPSPLDLLHGTRRNFLANYIHDSIRLRAIRDAECLAFGYLLYSYSKWRVSPTPATFARLAPFQHPLPIQLEQDHFGGIDMIIWPQMRVNMIRHWGEVDLLEVFDFLAACMKVRWPWNKDMLERDADDQLQVREDFRQIFSSEDGWGLTAEFIDRYPMLLEGMDVEALRFEITFPTEMYSY